MCSLMISRMFYLTWCRLEQLVRAVNEIGAAPGDLMAILEALRQTRVSCKVNW